MFENKVKGKVVLLISDDGADFKEIKELIDGLRKDGLNVISHHHTKKGIIIQNYDPNK